MTQYGRKDNLRNSKSKTGLILAAILFLAVISISVFAYVKSKNADNGSFSLTNLTSILFGEQEVKKINEEIVISNESDSNITFGVYGSYIVKCFDEGTQLLDNKGSVVWKNDSPLSNPIIKTNGKELLVADVGSKNFFVISGKQLLWKATIDENIINADINENGFVAIISESKRYKSEIGVYDRDGNETFRSYNANSFAISAKLNNYSSKMVVDCINTEDIKSFTRLKFQNLKENSVKVLDLKPVDGIFSVMDYIKDNFIFAASDTSVMCFDNNSNIRWQKEYVHVSAAVSTGWGKIACVVQDSEGLMLKIFLDSGKEYSSCILESNVKNINSYKGIIAVNEARKVDFYSEWCKIIGSYSSNYYIKNVYFLNKSEAVVITKGSIAIVKL